MAVHEEITVDGTRYVFRGRLSTEADWMALGCWSLWTQNLLDQIPARKAAYQQLLADIESDELPEDLKGVDEG